MASRLSPEKSDAPPTRPHCQVEGLSQVEWHSRRSAEICGLLGSLVLSWLCLGGFREARAAPVVGVRAHAVGVQVARDGRAATDLGAVAAHAVEAEGPNHLGETSLPVPELRVLLIGKLDLAVLTVGSGDFGLNVFRVWAALGHYKSRIRKLKV
jgi:hypothetical protein